MGVESKFLRDDVEIRKTLACPGAGADAAAAAATATAIATASTTTAAGNVCQNTDCVHRPTMKLPTCYSKCSTEDKRVK